MFDNCLNVQYSSLVPVHYILLLSMMRFVETNNMFVHSAEFPCGKLTYTYLYVYNLMKFNLHCKTFSRCSFQKTYVESLSSSMLM